jgi:hypothetical protein
VAVPRLSTDADYVGLVRATVCGDLAVRHLTNPAPLLLDCAHAGKRTEEY